MPRTMCPGCDRQFSVDGRPRVGQLVICPGCGDELVVVRESPLELDWPDYEENEQEEFDRDDQV